MRVTMDEIINAVCLHMADRKQVKPTDVEVELSYDDELGYSAEVFVQGRSQYLVEANLLEAIEQYMFKEYNRRVFRSDIRLGLDDEIYAYIG
ncbi:YxcD family protein [Paenibacillus gansuensis]|uniref:YxcD family protein n=1 Tax=Paenibacillus gansuensis TaxID=306542 RepID=A0ABW5PA01_9BACL